MKDARQTISKTKRLTSEYSQIRLLSRHDRRRVY
jgi:hypothetical protein